jgi:hypothetical protein
MDMSKRKKFVGLLTLLLVVGLVAVPLVALAGTGLTQTQSSSGLGNADVATVAGGIVRALIGLLGAIFLVLIVYAGLLWGTSAGNSERVGKAKQIIVAAVIGLILVMAAYTIADFAIVSLIGAGGGGENISDADAGAQNSNSTFEEDRDLLFPINDDVGSDFEPLDPDAPID